MVVIGTTGSIACVVGCTGIGSNVGAAATGLDAGAGVGSNTGTSGTSGSSVTGGVDGTLGANVGTSTAGAVGAAGTTADSGGRTPAAGTTGDGASATFGSVIAGRVSSIGSIVTGVEGTGGRDAGAGSTGSAVGARSGRAGRAVAAGGGTSTGGGGRSGRASFPLLPAGTFGASAEIGVSAVSWVLPSPGFGHGPATAASPPIDTPRIPAITFHRVIVIASSPVRRGGRGNPAGVPDPPRPTLPILGGRTITTRFPRVCATSPDAPRRRNTPLADGIEVQEAGGLGRHSVRRW